MRKKMGGIGPPPLNTTKPRRARVSRFPRRKRRRNKGSKKPTLRPRANHPTATGQPLLTSKIEDEMRQHPKWIAVLLLLVAACAIQAQTSNTADATTTSAATPASQKTKLPINAPTHEEYLAHPAAIPPKP